MALLVFAILNVMCCYFCYFVGTQKGYNGPLCAFAGLFGSFLACLILLLMPDKASDTFNSTAYNREVSELRQQVKDLQKRITELEHSAAPADQPNAAVHTEQAKGEPITEISKPVRFPHPNIGHGHLSRLREAATGKSEQLLRLRAAILL